MPAALEGAAGKLQGIECQVWFANLCLLALTALSHEIHGVSRLQRFQ
jgi:hypothetical protein